MLNLVLQEVQQNPLPDAHGLVLIHLLCQLLRELVSVFIPSLGVHVSCKHRTLTTLLAREGETVLGG